MTILLDTNLLVYAAMPSMAEHPVTREWLAARFADRSSFVGLAWPVLYAFVRLASNRRVMGDTAVPVAEAWEAASAFRRQASARLLSEGRSHATIADELMRTPGLGPNDVHDVHLAALAIEHGLTLCTHDHGFGRFRQLRWTDPLADAL